MGLLDIAHLGHRIVERKLDAAAQAHAEQPARADTGLPFGARIGSLLELPGADFALLEGSLLKAPAHPQLPVIAVSRMRFSADRMLHVFRLYTDVGIERKGEGRSFLQVLVRGEEITDAAYYQHVLRVVPQTPEEMEPFLGKGFGLGQSEFSLGRDLLEMSGRTPAQVTALLGTEGDEIALEYHRDTPTDAEYVAPYRSHESRLDDAIGDKGQAAEVTSMDYARTLPSGETERLLIALEFVSDKDGATEEAAHIDYLAGLPIAPARIKVI